MYFPETPLEHPLASQELTQDICNQHRIWGRVSVWPSAFMLGPILSTSGALQYGSLSVYSLLVCVLSQFQTTQSSTVWPAMTLPSTWTEMQRPTPVSQDFGQKYMTEKALDSAVCIWPWRICWEPPPQPECPRAAPRQLSPLHPGGRTAKSAGSCAILLFHFTYTSILYASLGRDFKFY